MPNANNPDDADFIPIPRTPSSAEEYDFFQIDAEKKRYQNHDLKSDIRLKRTYFSVTRKITRYWILFIVVASALQLLARVFERGWEASEFIALITTTTATLVGFWAIVGAYLFPKRTRDHH